MFIVQSWKKQGPQWWKVHCPSRWDLTTQWMSWGLHCPLTSLGPGVKVQNLCVCDSSCSASSPKGRETPSEQFLGWQSHEDGRWSPVLYNGTEHCKRFHQAAAFLLLGERDRCSLLLSVMVIAQPCLAGTCPGGSISSTQPVITYNSKQSGDSTIPLSTKQSSKVTATGVAT